MRLGPAAAALATAACAVLATVDASSASDAVAAAEADSGAVYFDPGPLARLHLSPYGDLRWTHDRAHDRPGLSSDLSATRIALRGGLTFAPYEGAIVLEAGVRASRGSERNTEARAAFRNEYPDTVEVDLLGIRLGGVAGTFRAGKMRSPFRLTEMLWDDDLRPAGASWTSPPWPRPAADLRVALGTFARSRLDFDDGRVSLAQAILRLDPDATSGSDLVVSYLSFTGLDALARDGLVRQNASVAAPPGYAGGVQFTETFRVLDVQLGGHGQVARVLWTATLDAAHNLEAEDDADALRARAALSGFGLPGGLEIGYVFQRIERDAVQDAFNSDDWWFHSRSRGHQVWVRVGQSPWPELRLAGFDERRDDVTTHTRRALLELRWRMPTR